MKTLFRYYIFFAFASIVASCAGENHCVNMYSFSFETTNSLTSSNIKKDNSFIINIHFPFDLVDLSEGTEVRSDTARYPVAFTIKENDVTKNESIVNSEGSLKDFDYEILTGLETISEKTLLRGSADHSFVCIPVSNGLEQMLKVKIKPQKTGSYYIILQNAYSYVNIESVFDNSVCSDFYSYSFHNTTSNDFSFLSEKITSDRSGKDFLQEWGGIAFNVID